MPQNMFRSLLFGYRRPPTAISGGVSELSALHVAGWAFAPGDPASRVGVEAVLEGSGEVLARVTADRFVTGLSAFTGGDGAQGFFARWPRRLSEAERARVRVRPVGGGAALAMPEWMTTEFTPLQHVAMDIVDNCNLRCPFCLYDYAATHATHLMEEATLDAALRFLPYTRDGEFWFSCLHEPTLHPRLTDFIDRVPRQYRRKIFFTTNLAKRMPPAFFAWLAGSGLHHINVSIESLDPAAYERLRKGARHAIFSANWEALLAALPHGAAPPRLRYIAMAYKSNVRELPDLVTYLLTERRADQVEIRYTYDVPHIDAAFKRAEYLDAADWQWLREALVEHGAARVMLVAPPAEAPVPVPAASVASGGPEPTGPVLPGHAMFQLAWDGTLRATGVLARSRDGDVREVPLLATNVRAIGDPLGFLDRLDGGG